MQIWINRLRAASGLVEHLMAAIEQVLIAIVGRLATWAAPLPSAVLVGRSTSITFELDGYWPWVMAGIVELIGLVTSSLWITAREWNLNKRKKDPPANESLALGLMGAYFVTTFALLLAIEIPIFAETGEWAGLTALLFPCLSAVALIALNERAAQSKRQGDYEAERAKPKARRGSRKAAIKPVKLPGKLPEKPAIIYEPSDRELLTKLAEFETGPNILRRNLEQWGALRELVWMRDNRCCRDCNKDLREDVYHCHHRQPESKGGPGKPSNLVTLCESCHGERHGHKLLVPSGATGNSRGDETRRRALRIMQDSPDISGARLGQRLNLSKSRGRQLKRELLPLLSGDNGSEKAPRTDLERVR